MYSVSAISELSDYSDSQIQTIIDYFSTDDQDTLLSILLIQKTFSQGMIRIASQV